MVQKLFFTVLVFASTLAAVFATKACYLCNSYTDANHLACVDPMTPYPTVNYTFCADNYACTRVSYITQKRLVVSRGCDPSGNTCNRIYSTLYASYPDIAGFSCYACTGNYCNNATQVRSSLKEVELVEGPEIL